MQREPLRDALRRELTGRIVAGELSSGHPIRLVETADSMGVSVTPLRESLVQLETDGFVRCDPGRGYSVVPMTSEEVEEVYPLIGALEAVALRQAPPGASGRARLESINRSFRQCEDPIDAQRLDREWHTALLAECRNTTLLGILDVLKSRAGRYEVAFMREVQRPPSSPSADQHDEIVACLGRGDIDGATRLLEENWLAGPEVLLPWLRTRVATSR